MIELQLLLNGLIIGGIYSLMSIGLSLIFGVIRIINFAHGEFLMVSMYLTFFAYTLWGISPYIAIFLIIPILFFMGAFIQRFAIQPILGSSAVMQIFITVGLSMFLINIAQVLWGTTVRSITLGLPVIRLGELSLGSTRLISFFLALSVTLLVMVVLKKTHIGRAIRSIAQDRKAAMLMGVNLHRTYIIAFGIGSACVGVAGVSMAPIFYIFPTVGTFFSLLSFVVVVLGGLGNVVGAFYGGLIIGLIDSFAGFYLPSGYKEAIYFIIFVIVLVVRPQGLLGYGHGWEEVGLK
jgi:branched-chain amino acid transport system permease protein